MRSSRSSPDSSLSDRSRLPTIPVPIQHVRAEAWATSASRTGSAQETEIYVRLCAAKGSPCAVVVTAEGVDD